MFGSRVPSGTPGGATDTTGSDFASVHFYDLNDSFVYFDVLLPHVLDVIVVLALFLVWFPRPEFSHVDTEDTRLSMEMRESDTLGPHAFVTGGGKGADKGRVGGGVVGAVGAVGRGFCLRIFCYTIFVTNCNY